MKNKILIIVENMSVPTDSRVWKEALALRDAGYGVSVLCPVGKGPETTRYELLEGVHVYRYPFPIEGNGLFGYLREYSSALFWQFLYSWRIFFERGFHVIQGCNPPDHIFLVAAPFKLFGVKYIFDHHDANPELFLAKFGSEGLLYKSQVWLEQGTYKVADVVMCTNKSYAGLAVSRGGHKPENVFVVRNGPDLKTFQAVAPVPELKHGKPFLVGYVGNIASQEGIDILLEVADHLRKIGRNDIHFTCVGRGPGLAELREQCTAMNLDSIFNFTGRVSDEDLLKILSTADVCVNPDRPCEMNDISTMIKIMEYMALGKPIVQFDLKEGRFSAGDSALYADPKRQVEDFGAKITHLLDHPEERRQRGEFGRQRVERELAWEYSVEHLLAAYRQALGSGPSPGEVGHPASRS